MSDKQHPAQKFFQTQIARRDFITRSLALGVSVGGLGSVLAACGGSTTPSANPNGPVTLNFMRWASDGGFPKHLAAITAVYPELSHIGVKVKVTGQNDSDVASALRLALAAGKDIPDFVMINRTELAEFADSGALMSLDNAFSSAKSDLYSGALEVVSYQRKIYGFPTEIKSKMFFYRADMFAQAGIQLSDLNTVDGFIDAGHKFHAKFPKSYILNLGTQPQQYWVHPLERDYLAAFRRYHEQPYEEKRALILADWRERLGAVQLEVPDERFYHAYYSLLAQLLMGMVRQEVRITTVTYPLFWLRDGVYIIQALDKAGFHAEMQAQLELLRSRIFAGGFGAEPDAFGEGIWAFYTHFQLTRDLTWLAQVYPDVRARGEWIIKALHTDTYLYGDVEMRVPQNRFAASTDLICEPARDGLA